MHTIPLAFIGVGDVATRDYLPEFHRIANRARIVAMCGRTPERVQAVAAQYGARPYTDYRQMLAETEAEAVVNLTPVQLHYATNLAALESGRHVYSEKTVAVTVAEARHLATVARERGLKFVCAPCVLLWRQYCWALALIRESAIGEVYAAHASCQAACRLGKGTRLIPATSSRAGVAPSRTWASTPCMR